MKSPVMLLAIAMMLAVFPDTANAAQGAEADADPGWGTIKGRVVFAPGPIPKPRVLIHKGDAKSAKSQFCARQDILSDELVVNEKNRGIRWVVALIHKPPAVFPDSVPPKGEVEIGIVDCMVQPHVLACHEGQKLVLSSSDPEGHNMVYNSLRSRPWILRVPEAKDGKKSRVEAPELKAEPSPIVVWGCSIHVWMKGFVFVTDHPYFAVTDKNGAFEIGNVPAGKLQLRLWHEQRGWGPRAKRDLEVEVRAQEITDLGDVELNLRPAR